MFVDEVNEPLFEAAVKLGVDLWMEDRRLKFDDLCCKNDVFEFDEVTFDEAVARFGVDLLSEAAVVPDNLE